MVRIGVEQLVSPLCAAAILLLTSLSLTGSPDAQEAAARVDQSWTAPDVDLLPNDDHGRLVRRGRDLITATYSFIGPGVADASKRYAGNRLSCQNCHLEAGAKKFGLPIWGLLNEFPQYSARSGAEIAIEDRVNACMTRSMNGRAMPADATEMQAIVAYVGFLSTGVPAGETLPGHGGGAMPELDRAADPERGGTVYARTCAACHGTDGEGVRDDPSNPTSGYDVPPLWGADSFNIGAGMARLTNAANFVHSNMPDGVTYAAPQLSVEDSWDVAAFMLSRPRPSKAGLEKDFPDLLKKPVDAPYGPYADGFSELQHRLGPFAPIRAALKKIAAPPSAR